MKTKIKWCKRCDAYQLHDVWKELFDNSSTNFFDRAFFGIFTLGASELMTIKYKECQVCGKVKKCR